MKKGGVLYITPVTLFYHILKEACLILLFETNFVVDKGKHFI